MNIFNSVVVDKGSKYAVSGAEVQNRLDITDVIKQLKKDKKFAKATHNTWAVLLSDGGPIKNDDGESGAGRIILQMLESANLTDHVIIVTRWYGGVKLGGDRFRRVKDCVRHYLDETGLGS